MSRMTWGALGTKVIENGVDRVVFYPRGGRAAPWNGVVGVKETSSPPTIKSVYLDGVKISERMVPDDFSAVISAIDYPDVVEQYEGLYGKPLSARPFDFTYRTQIISDVVDNNRTKIHLVYNALATPVQKNMQSLTNQATLTPFDWSVSTLPEKVPNGLPSAHLIFDGTGLDPRTVEVVENILYGDDRNEPRMPRPHELFEALDTQFYRIADDSSGLYPLVRSLAHDVQGHPQVGVYRISKGSRLTGSEDTGLYTLE